MKGGRTITVDRKKYRYRVGKGTTVIRRADNSVLGKVPNYGLLGVTPDVFARGQWKRTSDGMVTPNQVARAIMGLLVTEQLQELTRNW